MAHGLAIQFLLNQMRNHQGSLAGGSVEFFEAGSLTNHLDVFLDHQITQVAANPYTLSADGTAELFGIGTYRILVRNAAGVIVYDFDNVFLAPDIDYGIGTASTSTTVIDVSLTGSVSYNLLDTIPTQTIIMVGSTGYQVMIYPPAGFTFQNGLTYYSLYSDNEAATFFLESAKVHVVSK